MHLGVEDQDSEMKVHAGQVLLGGRENATFLYVQFSPLSFVSLIPVEFFFLNVAYLHRKFSRLLTLLRVIRYA